MIVRAIKDNPEEVMGNFDWFNDYEATRRYMANACPELLEQFDKLYQEWLDEFNSKLRDIMGKG